MSNFVSALPAQGTFEASANILLPLLSWPSGDTWFSSTNKGSLTSRLGQDPCPPGETRTKAPQEGSQWWTVPGEAGSLGHPRLVNVTWTVLVAFPPCPPTSSQMWTRIYAKGCPSWCYLYLWKLQNSLTIQHQVRKLSFNHVINIWQLFNMTFIKILKIPPHSFFLYFLFPYLYWCSFLL